MNHRLRKIPVTICGILIYICLYKMILLLGADMVVRYDFTGLDNLFHPDYEYYTIIGSVATQIPKSLVKTVYPDWDLEQSIYDDVNTNYYYTSLQYSPEGKIKIKTPLIDVGQGDKFALTYHEWTKETDPMSAKMRELLRNIIVENYDFNDFFVDDDEGWIWKSGDTYGLDGFIMIAPKGIEDRAVLDADPKLNVVKNGKIKKIMNYPRNGRLGFVYFTNRW